MNETNKNMQGKEQAPQSAEGANAAKPSFSWRRMLTRKWAFPAIYMAAAAIILTLMWVYQDSAKITLSGDQTSMVSGKTDKAAETGGKDTLPAAAKTEAMQWPVKDRTDVDVLLPFFDQKASNESRKAAMIEYNDTFTPHVGIDLARKDDQPFDVLATMSGKVTAVDKNPLVGNLVELTHPNGLVTVYQSLAEVRVAKGDDVKLGDVIATAGRNEMEKDEGTHVHFEIRQGADGPALNPVEYLPAN